LGGGRPDKYGQHETARNEKSQNVSSIYLRREDAQEINRAAGADPSPEAVPAQVSGQFDHWLVCELGKWVVQLRMSPLLDELTRLGGEPLSFVHEVPPSEFPEILLFLFP
jgi:hypothetical protein